MEKLLNTFHLSDNINFIKSLPDNSIDAIITDSPYGFGKEPDPVKTITDWIEKGFTEVKGKGFMGKSWDAFVPQPALWKECYRVLKPGGYLLSFFGTRTYDWGTMAIRFAGFEIRDCIQWIYGSGFPKSKACLKPANEPICVARKPGPLQMLNIDECRIEYSSDIDFKQATTERPNAVNYPLDRGVYSNHSGTFTQRGNIEGRWPSNVIFDEETAGLLDEQSGILKSGDKKSTHNRKNGYGNTLPANVFGKLNAIPQDIKGDIGGASRFFYVAKASPSERKGMKHPTIKPVKIMEQLVKLYCPENGIVLDPHFGTGTTGIACLNTGRYFIGIDNDQKSIDDTEIRMYNYLTKNNA